jgi:ABC-type Na+ efflux pump permease subunit
MKTIFKFLFAGISIPRKAKTWLIAQRDLRESASDIRLAVAMVMLTFVIPLAAVGGINLASHLLGKEGASIVQRLVGVGSFAVTFLPASFSLVLALESFSGERERGTLEALFAAPFRESEIYLGKMLAVIIPSLVLSYCALLVFSGGIFFSIGIFYPYVLTALIVVTMAQAFVMVSGATIVSSQTKTLRSANVLASFVIIPMSFVIQIESVLIISKWDWVLWAVAAVLYVVALILLRLGILGFNRENILAKESKPSNRRVWIKKLLSIRPKLFS